MTKLLVAASVLGLSLSTAGACDYQRSAKANVDQTVVASIVEEQNLSTPAQLLPPKADVPVEQETE